MGDLNRRTLLAGTAAAPLAAALPSPTNPAPVLTIHPDAAFLDALAGRIAEWARPVDDYDDSPEAVAASYRRDDLLADAVVTTDAGALGKLAHLCDLLGDHHQIDQAASPLLRALATFRASAVTFPPEMAAVMRSAAGFVEHAAQGWSRDRRTAFQVESAAAQWQRIDAIFERRGAKARAAANHEDAMQEGSRDAAGLNEAERELLANVRAMSEAERRAYHDAVMMLWLCNHALWSLEGIARDHPAMGRLLTMMAGDFVEAARAAAA